MVTENLALAECATLERALRALRPGPEWRLGLLHDFDSAKGRHAIMRCDHRRPERIPSVWRIW